VTEAVEDFSCVVSWAPSIELIVKHMMTEFRWRFKSDYYSSCKFSSPGANEQADLQPQEPCHVLYSIHKSLILHTISML